MKCLSPGSNNAFIICEYIWIDVFEVASISVQIPQAKTTLCFLSFLPLKYTNELKKRLILILICVLVHDFVQNIKMHCT